MKSPARSASEGEPPSAFATPPGTSFLRWRRSTIPPRGAFASPQVSTGSFSHPTRMNLPLLRGSGSMFWPHPGPAAVRAQALRVLEQKIMASVRASARRRIAPDLEALVQAETIAVHAGPRPFEDAAVLAATREAIKSLRTLTFIYDGGREPGRTREVTPCGILFGRSNYLVAAEGAGEPRSWRFDRMREVTIGERPGAPQPDFSLPDYADESFGIYHGAQEDVVLRIAPERAAEALAWRFHNRQTVTALPDGSVQVCFRAGGMLELAWHLFTWSDAVEIVAPEFLCVKSWSMNLTRLLARHDPASMPK